jgi:cation diffusion facilitator CzcD-associated flavoprotein CzcO
MRIAIVGAGFSGIGMAVALQEAGFPDVTIYEKAEDLGGVWHYNTYPGAACDVPSYLYSYSYEQRRDWSQPCSPQDEILGYLHDVASRHGVDRLIRFGVEITAAAWDDEAAAWTLTAAGGDEIEADALVLACGQLHRPRLPDIPGREDFAGHSFHSAEWDHGHDLRGARVAVIGTGASAVQFVPPVAEQAGHLDVYQRTAPYIAPRWNPRYPAAVRGAIRWIPGLQAARRRGMTLFMESFITGLTRFPPLRWVQSLWATLFMRMQVRDKAFRKRIWPDYPFGCKRILFSSYYLPALQRPNVELVTDRIERITANGVVTADGRERPVDTIIYGTGFEAHAFMAPMSVTGAGGQDLHHAWSGGARAHLGITVAGFPNLFLLYGPNTNLGVGSIIVMIEAQVGYVLSALQHLRRTGAAAVDVRPEVEAASDAETQRRLQHSIWTACQSWYREEDGRIVNNWPGYMKEYVDATRALDPAQYDLVPPPRGREPAAA